MDDQFAGPPAWDDYISALEAASPAIEALAVTDYYVTETYQRILDFKNAGRLPNVGLIFQVSKRAWTSQRQMAGS